MFPPAVETNRMSDSRAHLHVFHRNFSVSSIYLALEARRVSRRPGLSTKTADRQPAYCDSSVPRLDDDAEDEVFASHWRSYGVHPACSFHLVL